MRAGRQPCTIKHRRARRRGRTHDLRRGHGGGQCVRRIGTGLHRQSFAGQRVGQGRGARRGTSPDPYPGDCRPHGAVRADHVRGQRAGANHEQVARIIARQIARGQHRGGGRATHRERLAVEHRTRLARVPVEQHVQRLHCAGGTGVGHHRHHLHAKGLVAPRRHQQQGIPLAERVGMTARHRGARREGVAQHGYQRGPRQGGVDLLGGMIRQHLGILCLQTPCGTSRRTPPGRS